MTLYDYIKKANEGEEITVWDTDYEMETYFYNDDPGDGDDYDAWQGNMLELAKCLHVCKVHDLGVEVNLTSLVESHLEELRKANLFINCTVDDIMEDMQNILSGYVSEEWLEEFVGVVRR